MSLLVKVCKTIISVAMAISVVVAPSVMEPANEAFTLLDAENCLLNFVAVSDTHIDYEDESMADYFTSMLSETLADVQSAEVKPDAFLITGDITNDGDEEQWQLFEKVMSGYDPAERILLAVGNHDTWTRESGDKTFEELFVEYNEKITGKDVKRTYYSTKVNGYYFIFLASETDSTAAYFSDKQLKWLKKEMKKAAKTDKPVFVVSHWPLNQTHGLPVTFGDEEYTDMTGGMGEQSKKVQKILNKYENVFLLSGHIHSGFSNASMEEKNTYQSVEQHGNIVSVNLPSLATPMPQNGYFMVGTGYAVEVYKDKVVFRARNFAADYWLPGYDYTVRLK